jgi:uncharacterized protein (TIGR00251 family)
MATSDHRDPDTSRIVTETDAGTIVTVWAVPGTSRNGIVGVHGDALRIRVSAPAEGGKANRALAAILAEISGSDVELLHGHQGRRKTFLLKGADAAEVRRRISDQTT